MVQLMPTALTGDALKAKLAELGQAPENVAAIECGYVSKAGKASLAAFRQAQLEAHGLALSKSAGSARKGKRLSFVVTTGKTGNIVMAGGYAALLGVEPGGQVAIKHDGNSLVLTAVDVTPTATTAEVCPAVRPVDAAAPVVTYDSTPALELAVTAA